MSDSGTEVEVRDDKGAVTGRFCMADGCLHGMSTLYSAGRVVAEICYEHGVRQGDMRSYGEAGQLSSVVPHAADLPHGEARFFYADGSLARRAHYREGRLHGTVCDYGPDGAQLECSNYIEGRKQEAPAAAAPAPDTGADAGRRKSWLARIVEG